MGMPQYNNNGVHIPSELTVPSLEYRPQEERWVIVNTKVIN